MTPPPGEPRAQCAFRLVTSCLRNAGHNGTHDVAVEPEFIVEAPPSSVPTEAPPPASVVIPALKRDIARSLGRYTRAPVPGTPPDEPLDAESWAKIDAFCDRWTAPQEGAEEELRVMGEELRALVREVRQPVEQEPRGEDPSLVQWICSILPGTGSTMTVSSFRVAINREINREIDRVVAREMEARVADLEERGAKLDFAQRETASHELGCDVIVHGPDAACSCEYQIVVAALDGWAKRGT